MLNALLLSFAAMMVGQAPATARAEYEPPKAIVRTAPAQEITLRDAARDRDVLLTVRRPRADDNDHDVGETGGPAPLVIFSHGAGGSGEAFEHLSTALALRGYVVVHPWHSDSIKLAQRRGERGHDPKRGLDQLVDRVDLRDRLADVQFILESIDELEKALEAPGLIDRQRIGMAGHSAGAMTTQTAAGLMFYPRARGRGRSMPVEEIDAFAVISGQGTTRRSITERSWETCTRPMLVVAGSRDETSLTDETPASRRHPFEHAPADGTKYLLFIDGATHSSYQGRDASRRLREETPLNVDWIERITTAAVVAHMDAYVRDDKAAKTWLDSGAIKAIEGGRLEWRHK
ncbi:MAG: hypothetical protein SYC29_16180 [Planctomycetota bacterium]|nr:hypothetical protein [Planctomycetota bacterium]